MTGSITIEGVKYTEEAFLGNERPPFADKSAFHGKLYTFLHEWFSDSPTLTVQTSGSTGTPKPMQVSKERMLNSARLTCSFLNLQAGNKALLCLPLDYIAGKMVVVRALYAELDLYPIQPDGHPLIDTDISFDFAAMIPLQVQNSLENETERERLAKINSLIIGGGAIDEGLATQLAGMPNDIYSTYGMTETLSHIALRKLSGEDKSAAYRLFPSVTISLDADNALIIDAPLVADERLYTNDITEIHEDGTFSIIGRRDNIINSGGIKIQAEMIENELKSILKDIPFAISSLPDSKLGEIIVLATEKAIDEEKLDALPKYHRPRKVMVTTIPLTETGKINRKKLKELISKG
ncbi:AMP-binding protein [Dysgonomonas sp. 25]|uniref:AMP-binding protein n=1 Tax=Dysgonomonas sp. 25 TaxID=2302933 RepID=UPI0013D22E79|nr:AMP-binding protein [Dysgonomonas sp. 25]NDV67408.1 O-succinylbenzoic acid--CoA ligase [Dysgonomonas sp. 25]